MEILTLIVIGRRLHATCRMLDRNPAFYCTEPDTFIDALPAGSAIATMRLPRAVPLLVGRNCTVTVCDCPGASQNDTGPPKSVNGVLLPKDCTTPVSIPSPELRNWTVRVATALIGADKAMEPGIDSFPPCTDAVTLTETFECFGSPLCI